MTICLKFQRFPKMQLDSTLEMSLEESTDTLPYTGLDQTADQSDIPDRNGLQYIVIDIQLDLNFGLNSIVPKK